MDGEINMMMAVMVMAVFMMILMVEKMMVLHLVFIVLVLNCSFSMLLKRNQFQVTVGMLTSLPFLIFSGPITDTIGHINVIVIGMLAYFARLLGYSFLEVIINIIVIIIIIGMLAYFAKLLGFSFLEVTRVLLIFLL